MTIKSILDVVWSRYGLIGAVVVVGILVALDQLYHFGLGALIISFLSGQ